MDVSLNRLTLHFRDAELERRYRAAENPKATQVARHASLAGIVLSLVPSALLQVLVPPDMLQSDKVLAGGASIALVFFIAYLGSFTRWTQLRPQAAMCAMSCLMAAAIASLLRVMPQEFVMHRGFMFLAVQIFGTYGLLRLRILPGALTGTLCVLIYEGIVAGSGRLEQLDLMRHLFWLSLCNIWGMLVCYQLDLASRREFAARLELEHERARAESLLLNILPAAIASRLKEAQQPIAEHSDEVTVLFADLVGFTPLSATKQPSELVALLDQVFTEFDHLAHQHGLEKIKTIGDAYMAVAGLPEPQGDHALRAGRMAMAMLDAVRRAAAATGEPLQLRVGLHSGPVVAGVIGRSKFSYDLWGDTVNTASRMESSGLPDAVQCTPATALRLGAEFRLQVRGVIEVKGKGPMETFFVAPAL